ncbi:MAG: phosphate/phosphite/phosphonate ABC transporter substrate-binding protein [Oscillatoriaceae bacterium SKW80]|nr:phosphate/phosphite/phosphonate ABC transporter substrate-binding protein [Oscillatoriaceae bacterium SKYG93]MCX8120215.1 phosphate/phosphite/phosphonate ABC transporter substrate-binding protein [Oscillatoriaceae bacterium SKW80]MDW8453141.1 phosphate/phosphite/phosphonate ABC transporter substrate-binding protein [Oscillatoriaceae cyanobacterium SKYGB_i_bin93]HIK28947.1 phosphate/phosphite/phosphonate ABC transporter substrate-binding protein [Oscillatoriaceae cyanobacterium M7585_C2015_266
MHKLLSASALILLLGGMLSVSGRQEALATSNPRQDHHQRASAQNTLTRLTIVFPTRRDSVDLQNKANAVAQFLSKQIGIPVDAVVADETAAVEALRANRADVAFLSSRPALKAEQLAGARLVLAEVRPDYSGGHTYNSVLVVRKDSPLRPQGSKKQTLQQLKGKRIAFASRTSGSGFIIPIGEFVGAGLIDGPDRLENFFSQVTYGDGYSSALQAVLRGQADVAAVSEYALNPPWITAQEAEQLRVLQEFPGVPAHGIVIDDDVPAAMRDKIVNALLKLNDSANNGLLRALYNSTSLVKVNHDSHLAPMRQAMQRARIQP